MSNGSREAILGKIRGALKASDDRAIEREEVAMRLARKERGVIPARAQLAQDAQVEMFLAYSEKVSSSTERVASYDDLPGAIAAYLRGRNLPARLRMGSDGRLASIDWSREPQLQCDHGPSDGGDKVGLSHALGGVAETGTAFFTSGPDNPTTLNFLPETHIMVVRAADIVGDYESLLDRLRDERGEARMPRVVNMITGPSRSGDIEQTILLGAHGPRDVHVIVVG